MSKGTYNFKRQEVIYTAREVKIAQVNEFASSVLLTNDRIVSRYLERENGGFKINLVELNIELGDDLEVRDFYFDQSMLVLQIKDKGSGLETIKFFTYY